MEQWERDHIEANINRLVEDTTCGVCLLRELMSKRVLGRDDLDQIDNPNVSDSKKCLNFYKVIQGKANAYKILIEVLEGQQQSGAVSILKEGKPENYRSDTAQTLQKDVNVSNKEETSSETVELETTNSEQLESFLPSPTKKNEREALSQDQNILTNLFSTNKRKLIFASVLLILILTSIVVAVIVATGKAKTGPAPNLSGTQKLPEQNNKYTSVSTLNNTGEIFGAGNKPLNNGNYSRITFATILLIGPTGTKGVTKLVTNLFNANVKCIKVEQSIDKSISGVGKVVRYEISGKSSFNLSTPSTDSFCPSYNYRLVILDMPVLQSPPNSPLWNFENLAAIRLYADNCKQESHCVNFFLGMLISLTDGSWSPKKWSSTEENKFTEFISTLSLINTNSNHSVQFRNHVLLFDEYYKEDQGKFRDKLVNLIKSLKKSYQNFIIDKSVKVESRFWQYLESKMFSTSQQNEVASSLFSKLRKGESFASNGLQCCYGAQQFLTQTSHEYALADIQQILNEPPTYDYDEFINDLERFRQNL